MKTIHRYPTNSPCPVLLMPTGAVILSITAKESVSIYALVDPTAEKEARRFVIVSTGQTLTDQIMDSLFLKTLKLSNGSTVHVFEVFTDVKVTA